MNGNQYINRNRKVQKISRGMKKKLAVLFGIVLLAFVGLVTRLILINRDNGEEYKKQVLSQQKYDSKIIPFRRGQITDKNGTVLAASEKVYSIILDAKQLVQSKDEEAMTETLSALSSNFGLKEGEIRTYLEQHPDSQYYVLAKQLPYDEIEAFRNSITVGNDAYNAHIQGIWLEESFIRRYPNNSLASDVIGFTTSDNVGSNGLEGFYNNELSGSAGREYGYLDSDATLERTTIAATDGNSLVTTLDGNIQTIVEKYLRKFNEDNKNVYHEGNGAQNVGCIVQDIHNGNILAMASYPDFDLNNPRDPERLIGATQVDENGNRMKVENGQQIFSYINEETLAAMDDEEVYRNLNALWRNFTISDTYEPGSVAKPFTAAVGLETGAITGNEVYQCDGFLNIGGWDIYCHNTYGHGPITVERGIEVSCNVAMMKIGQAIGSRTFAKFQQMFGFGLKTNIDLYGEARTQGLTYSAEKMGSTELATNTFGQGFNVDMIEMITAFSSLINGGYYYEPHVVSRIVSSSGATVRNIEPRILRQTVSQSTSEQIIQYCNQVVAGPEGTGKTARPAGYMIGGKTGTAETTPRDKRNYVVSFMGYAPAEDPQIAIYVVVDRPNAHYQDDAKFATGIVRNILTEVMPYMNFPMTEELSEKEKAEIEELREQSVTTANTASSEEGAAVEEGDVATETEGDMTGTESGTAASAEASEPVWKSFEKDPETGYYIDPNNGNLIDPVTGNQIGGSSLPENSGEMLEVLPGEFAAQEVGPESTGPEDPDLKTPETEDISDAAGSTEEGDAAEASVSAATAETSAE